jgi:hypothetical protein
MNIREYNPRDSDNRDQEDDAKRNQRMALIIDT